MGLPDSWEAPNGDSFLFTDHNQRVLTQVAKSRSGRNGGLQPLLVFPAGQMISKIAYHSPMHEVADTRVNQRHAFVPYALNTGPTNSLPKPD